MAETITSDTIKGLMDTIQKLYLSDDIPWVIGYSGGKDSTATLQLIWLSIEKLPLEQRKKKKIHIINTDTLVESPVVSKWVEKSLIQMEEKAATEGLPFTTHRLFPDYNNTFWVNLLGKGYPFPRLKYRWCTDRLKIQPVNKFIKEQIAEHGEIVLVIGTRKAESARRARTMAYYEKKRVRELLSPNPSLANELVFSPLEDWTDDDVWIFLMQYKNPWGYSNMDLLTLYRGATADNECPLMTEKNLPSCGKSRFGCWVCTMVERDKSMEAMIANDDEKIWMTPLLRFRNKFGNEIGDREKRDFRRNNGSLMGSYGALYHGPYKKEVREKWLKELLEIQKDINEKGPIEFRELELIKIQELREIRRIWVIEKHEFDDMVPRIYTEVMGKPFDDPEWVYPEIFGKEEWDLLQEICTVYRERDNETLAFELMYSLIDMENQSSGVNQRKGILDQIEHIIRRNFYRNEQDATSYYATREYRKKNYGSKYNSKFMMDYDTKQEIDDIPELADSICQDSAGEEQQDDHQSNDHA